MLADHKSSPKRFVFSALIVRAPLKSLINCLMWGTLSALTSRDAEAPIVRL